MLILSIRWLQRLLVFVSLLPLIGFQANASEQSGGPSKEETADYITSHFNAFEELFCNGHYYNIDRVRMNSRTDHLTIEYRHRYYNVFSNTETNTTHRFNINMKDVETIAVVSGDGWEGCRVWGLQFKRKGDSNQVVLHLPLMRAGENNPIVSVITSKQIYKALNHYRKLCGAKEPLKFD